MNYFVERFNQMIESIEDKVIKKDNNLKKY